VGSGTTPFLIPESQTLENRSSRSLQITRIEWFKQPCLVLGVVLALHLLSCAARMPTVEEVNGVVLELRHYRVWAWALGIGAIHWAKLLRRHQ
jgi:hypothetical protein